MKRIVSAIVAVAALAACTKSEVQYEPAGEIGFNVVAGNLTKAVVDGNKYQTALNMFIYAWTNGHSQSTPDYISNGEFKYKGNVTGTDVWSGTPDPYYWPNVKTLHFAGYSDSGNINETNGAKPTFDCSTGTLTITGYNPGTATGEGANDLMWFPGTNLKTPDGYGKSTSFVSVDMYHTCAWITFLVKGDAVTGGTTPYTVTEMHISGIDLTADVACSATISGTTVTPSINWTNNSSDTDTYTVPVNSGGIKLQNEVATNVETQKQSTTLGNIVVIPQTPGKLSLTYTYKSPNNVEIIETVKDLDLALAKDNSEATGPNTWEPGKHYIYTITIKTNEILIAPKPVDWTDENYNVTVE